MDSMEPNARPARSAHPSGGTHGNDAFPSPSITTEPDGFAITASGPAAFGKIGPMTDRIASLIEARGLEPELLAMHGVGASDRLRGDCIGIPYVENGQRVGVKYRTLGETKAFSQEAGSRQILWNVDCLRDETLAKEPLIVTEGEMDAFAAMQAGHPRVVSVPGGAPSQALGDEAGKKYQFLTEAEPLLRDVQEIILCVDGDAQGANLLHDLSLRLGKRRCKWVKYPRDCKDLNDALKRYGVRGVQETIRRAQWCKVEGMFRMSSLPPVNDEAGVNIGIDQLAAHYRMRRGDFCVVTGVPSHGKSSFVNEVCCRMAWHHDWHTVFASFEQQPQTAHRRALRSFHGRKRAVDMTPEELAAADEWIDRCFTFIQADEDTDADLAWVLERCAAAIVQNGASIVVIDPWNEMDHVRPPDMSLTEYTGYAIKQFRKLARKYHAHVIVVAHPTKMVRGKDGKYPVPTLYDISDSAHWFNKSDVGVVIHRESTADPQSETSIRVVKSRYHDQIGRPGEIRGVWDINMTRYRISPPQAVA